MKKLGFILLLIISHQNLTKAQEKLDYDDIYAALPSVKPEQGLYMLLQYQKQFPDFANTYAQIGHLCEQKLKVIDPLRNLEDANFWVDNAILYYGVFSKFAHKNEAGKNQKYYANMNIPVTEKKLSETDIANFIKRRLDSCQHYKKNINETFEKLKKSKEAYDHAIEMYASINDKYENLDELLLHTYDPMLKYIDTLNNYYNTAIQLFDAYKKQLKQYPILDYNQTYKLKNIETFRLDGLTKSDFLEPEFFIWNFEKWVLDFKNTYRNDIVSLRKEITNIQNTFDKNRKKLEQTDTISPKEKFETFDALFFYRLGHYDSYSIVKDLFKYLDLRQQFLKYGNLPISSPADSALSLLNIKLRFYYNLTKMQNNVEVAAIQMAEEITKEKVNRFKQYLKSANN